MNLHKVRTAVKNKKKESSNMNKLINSIAQEQNYTLTENGALTHASTLSSLLDFFGLGAALRSRTEEDVLSLFRKAFGEDQLLALKTLFYIRDARGGQGERKTFRTILKWLGNEYPNFVIKNLSNIVLYGRYDDLFVLEGTKSWDAALAFWQSEWNKGFENNSLIFKWAPSSNTSSKETRRLARVLYKSLDLSEKEYRQTLSHMRNKTGVVEPLMCSKDWSAIEYSHVPSKASLTYKDAFRKHDQVRYEYFLDSVKKGETKINASTLYPYEIVEKVFKGDSSDTLDVLWSALPDYIGENKHNGIVVADVSGSMNGRPMAVSISLAMYFAERTKGQFKDSFLTFSENPTLQKVNGNNIREKVLNLSRADWGMSTNLQSVFNLILTTGIKHRVPQSEMPDTIYIVSDMEFNSACGRGLTNFELIKNKYESAGYKVPNLVFWNVNARNNQSPITKDDKGTCLVSGCSPSILKTLLSGNVISPVDVMLDTINAERYETVTI